jgi:superfamily II DNA or RNA helicase
MATGTGKTITALAAAVRLYQREGRLALVVAVPYQHLVDQWNRDARRFGFSSILAYKSSSTWIEQLHQDIAEFRGHWSRLVCVIVTHSTFCTEKFQKAIAGLDGAALLIADEAHHLGSETGQSCYPPNFGYRLALSATPERWFDDIGTSALRDYFGATVFEYPLAKAIGTCLTPYYYFPHSVELTDDEMEEYVELSEKIAKLYFLADTDENGALQTLLFKRAGLLNNAEQKLPALSALVDEQPSMDHALFYCAPPQVDPVLQMLGNEKKLLVHRFTAEEGTKERQQLLAQFASGELDALVAMKCLDEGVDVPATRMAFILASSSNPREFIQRRGRILRRSDGKQFAVIHDLLTLPPTEAVVGGPGQVSQVERNLLRHELARFAEFSEHAINKHTAIDAIWAVAKRFGVMDF